MPPVAGSHSLVDIVDTQSRAATWVVLATGGLALAAADHVAPEVGMGPAYIPLIALAGWRLGVGAACVVALTAALLNIYPHHVHEAGVSPGVAVLRGILRLGTYAFVVATACALRRVYDRERTAARRDALTGAMNRAAFEAEARMALECPAGTAARVLALADLDGFKAVNDAEGHAAGDEALRTFADLAMGLLSGSERLGRLGGDEFVMLLSAGTEDAALARARTVHRRLSDGLRRPGRDLAVSMGVVVLRPGAVLDCAEALRRADALMYAAKAAGGGGLRVETVGRHSPPPSPAMHPDASMSVMTWPGRRSAPASNADRTAASA